MLLGRVIAPINEFIRLVATNDYDAALGLALRTDDASTFRQHLVGIWGEMVDEIGEMPADGWQNVYLYQAPDGERVQVDVPVWDRSGVDMDWFFKFSLIPGHGEEWRIDHVHASH